LKFRNLSKNQLCHFSSKWAKIFFSKSCSNPEICRFSFLS